MQRLLPPTLLLLALTSLTGAQGAHQGPFPAFAPTSGASGSLDVPYGMDVYQDLDAASSEALVTLEGFPVPGDSGVETLDLVLRPVSAMATGARAVLVEEDGSELLYEPRTRCFSGHLAGGGRVFLGATPTRLEGWITRGDELFVISSGPTPGGTASVARADHVELLAAAGWCGTEPRTTAPGDKEHQVQQHGSARVKTPLHYRVADVYIDCDHRLRDTFGNSPDTADYAALLVSAVSEIYRRDLGVPLNIPDGYLRVWASSPWAPINNLGDLSIYSSWWRSAANPDRGLPRAAVHLFTRFIGGGVTTTSGLCNNGGGYAMSGLNGSFPSSVPHTSSGNWDLIVVAHEFGHMFGTGHTWDSYVPIIQCDDGSGPDNGTIMSYCHLSSSSSGGFGNGGIHNVGLRFHARVQDRLRPLLSVWACMPQIPVRIGDYDFDGDVDAADLLEADGILAQGFTSSGAEETFDIDQDGDFDAIDRELMVTIINGAPPASAVMNNGSGTNPTCYFNTTPPRLGTTWESAVVAFGAGTPTFIFGSTQPDAGRFLAIGELLVLLPGVGGDLLFVHSAASSGFTGDHLLALPPDAALAGATASIQGMIGGANTQLCNRLDVTLSPYE